MKKFKSNRKQEPIRQNNLNKRTKLKSTNNINLDNTILGQIILIVGSKFLVKHQETISECILSGVVESPYDNASLAVVGDWVNFLPNTGISASNMEKTGTIVKVNERITRLSRKTPGKGDREQVIASNVDNVLIVLSTFEPQYNKRLLDRYLVAAEIGQINPIIVINKIDLVDNIDIIKEDLVVYRNLEYEIYYISTYADIGIEILLKRLGQTTSVLSGPSGVGKSSLLNKLIGDSVQSIGDVSDRTSKGQHTTSFVKMFDILTGARIIDSPGIREFGVVDIEANELQLYYHDFDEYFPNCKYPGCSHIHEPECAVINAVEQELIDTERYMSYVNFFDSISS